jgi:mannose-6-phosphate isomerase-like protein (cupin superfamily)
MSGRAGGDTSEAHPPVNGATRTTGVVSRPREAIELMAEEGCSPPRFWGNPPDDRYGWHSHRYHKVLFCLTGSITFHTRSGDIELGAGDRLDVAPGTEHAATVGPLGVECVEAPR